MRALVRAGHRVRCLVRSESGRRFLPESGIEIVQGDLTRLGTVEQAMEGTEAVVHVAHIRFAPAIIRACERHNIRRAIFFSSTRRFTRFDCQSAREVRQGEQAIEAGSLDYTILRPSMMYGSSRDNNISRLIELVRRHRIIPLVGGGGNLVQPVFVLDVVEALLKTLERPEAIGSAYTLAGPEAMSYRHMIETIARVLQRKVFFVPVPLVAALLMARFYETFSRRPAFTSEQVRRMAEDRSFDINKARCELGFNPVPFEEGVRRQVAGEIDAVWSGGAGKERRGAGHEQPS